MGTFYYKGNKDMVPSIPKNRSTTTSTGTGNVSSSYDYYDDFTRADTAAGVISASPTGHTYYIEGSGAAGVKILNNQLVSDLSLGTYYAEVNLGATPDVIGATFNFNTGNGGGNQQGLVIFLSDISGVGIKANWFHLVLQPNNIALSLSNNGVNSGNWHDALNATPDRTRPVDGTKSTVTVNLLGSNTCKITWDEDVYYVTDPILDSTLGKYFTIEAAQSQATAIYRVDVNSAWAGNYLYHDRSNNIALAKISSKDGGSTAVAPYLRELRITNPDIFLGTGYFSANVIHNMYRLVGTTANTEYDLGTLTVNSSGGGFIEVSFFASAGGISLSKKYFLPIRYGATGSGVWHRAIPLASSGAYGSEDIDLDINVTTVATSLRLRRVAGSSTANVYVSLITHGIGTSPWVESTANSVVSAPTVAYTYNVVGGSSFKAEYDTSNYFTAIPGSTGIVTFDAVGSGAKFVFSDNIDLSTKNLVTDTSTGTKIGTGTTQKLGFFNATPVAQLATYTQTYSTASRTVGNATSTAVATTASTLTTPYGYTTQAQADDIITELNALQTDVVNLKKVVTSLIDDLQSLGFVA